MMGANERWANATKEEILERNALIISALSKGLKKSGVAKAFSLTPTRVSNIYEKHLRTINMGESGEFLGSLYIKSVRAANCMKNLNIKSLEDLYRYGAPDGEWDKSLFLGKKEIKSRWGTSSIIPNFGKTSYKTLIDHVKEFADKNNKPMHKKFSKSGAFDAALTPQEKEYRLYLRLKEKYEPQYFEERQK